MVEPLLKWAGGKRWLTRSENWRIPPQYVRYFEPFLGGGSVFFALAPNSGILNDSNSQLIQMYGVLRDQPLALRSRMEEHQALHSSDHYYRVRANVPPSELDRAARFLYLNRSCWNGLYRVNRRGEFNVPIGTKKKVHFESDDYELASSLLKRVELRSTDFEAIIDTASEGDFVFLDPPYTVKHNQNGFAGYNEKIFSWDDQVRLAAAVKRAASRGCFVAVTNADHESVRSLYTFAAYRPVARSSVMAADPAKRGTVTEALFTCNY